MSKAEPAKTHAEIVSWHGATGAFYKVRPEAGQLLLPYILWLVFANLLNLAGAGTRLVLKFTK